MTSAPGLLPTELELAELRTIAAQRRTSIISVPVGYLWTTDATGGRTYGAPTSYREVYAGVRPLRSDADLAGIDVTRTRRRYTITTDADEDLLDGNPSRVAALVAPWTFAELLASMLAGDITPEQFTTGARFTVLDASTALSELGTVRVWTATESRDGTA